MGQKGNDTLGMMAGEGRGGDDEGTGVKMPKDQEIKVEVRGASRVAVYIN